MVIVEYISLFLLAMVPMIEYMITIPAGIILMQLHPVPVTLIVIAGNVFSLLLFIIVGDRILLFRSRFRRSRPDAGEERKERFRRYYDKYGAIGLSFIGCFFLSSQLTVAGMIPLGISRQRTFFWGSTAVVVYAVLFTFLSVFAEGWVRGMF
ncbi:hypothetical protein [Oceanobacillus sp. CFH 90083]|uniref:hypothetical protein n=1 Tax=Oceanobacillus sp. CFH 90083 TaxID=2592336 RepID=UPI00128BD6D4|nr:hypothetical protein [Oceanobacillus sp. CFH 90083]